MKIDSNWSPFLSTSQTDPRLFMSSDPISWPQPQSNHYSFASTSSLSLHNQTLVSFHMYIDYCLYLLQWRICASLFTRFLLDWLCSHYKFIYSCISPSQWLICIVLFLSWFLRLRWFFFQHFLYCWFSVVRLWSSEV